MQQFQPLPSFDENGGANLVGAQFREGFVEDGVSAFQPRFTTANPSPFINTGQQPAPMFPARNTSQQPAPVPTTRSAGKQPVPPSTTAQLAAFAKNSQPTPTTGYLSLAAALQSTMTSKTTGRMIVIPGTKKSGRTDASNGISTRRMSVRLRHAIIIAVCVLIIIITLLTLTPLAAGQGGIPGVSALGNWVRTAQLVWDVQSHQNAVATPAAATGTGGVTANPPPMQLPTSQYIAIAQQDATAAGISPVYFVRQINKESGFNPNAVSPAGAVGIAQFLPSTAAGLGINPWDPIQALRAAANVMGGYSHMYGGDYAKALAAYNAGTGTVQNAVNNCGANWMNCIPAETRNYISAIMGI